MAFDHPVGVGEEVDVVGGADRVRAAGLVDQAAGHKQVRVLGLEQLEHLGPPPFPQLLYNPFFTSLPCSGFST